MTQNNILIKRKDEAEFNSNSKLRLFKLNFFGEQHIIVKGSKRFLYSHFSYLA